MYFMMFVLLRLEEQASSYVRYFSTVLNAADMFDFLQVHDTVTNQWTAKMEEDSAERGKGYVSLRLRGEWASDWPQQLQRKLNFAQQKGNRRVVFVLDQLPISAEWINHLCNCFSLS